jgi:hypothetical protein
VDSLLTLFFDILLLAVVGLSLPFMLAAMAGHGVHLGLENLASARYLGGSTARNISNAVGGLSHQIQRMSQSISNRNTLQQRMAAGEAATAATAKPSQQPTTQLAKQTPINAFGVPRTKTLNGGAKPTSKI